MRFVRFALMLVVIAGSCAASWGARVPTVDGEWWTIARDPDLGELTSAKQQPVDFAIWRAGDGAWQVCSCIRGTKEAGKTRLLFRWEGASLEHRDWKAMGIFMRADTKLGETAGGLQAPFVFKEANRFYMVYGCWEEICLAESSDGKSFTRRVGSNGRAGMFGEGAGTNTRDPMVSRIGDVWHCYYAAYPDRHCAVFCRTSKDLVNWSDSTKVATGGEAGDGPFSAECPFVVHLGDLFYLFRTQKYGVDAMTRVYISHDPMDFGVDAKADEHLVAKLAVAAPEVFEFENQWYIAALRPDLKGIQLARLKWE